MSYIVCYINEVHVNRKQEYSDVTAQRAAILKEYGATRVVECWGDEIEPMTAFKNTLEGSGQANHPQHTLAISWIVWPSKDASHTGIRNAQADPRMKNIPVLQQRLGMFDEKPLLISGGFEVLLDMDK